MPITGPQECLRLTHTKSRRLPPLGSLSPLARDQEADDRFRTPEDLCTTYWSGPSRTYGTTSWPPLQIRPAHSDPFMGWCDPQSGSAAEGGSSSHDRSRRPGASNSALLDRTLATRRSGRCRAGTGAVARQRNNMQRTLHPSHSLINRSYCSSPLPLPSTAGTFRCW